MTTIYPARAAAVSSLLEEASRDHPGACIHVRQASEPASLISPKVFTYTRTHAHTRTYTDCESAESIWRCPCRRALQTTHAQSLEGRRCRHRRPRRDRAFYELAVVSGLQIWSASGLRPRCGVGGGRPREAPHVTTSRLEPSRLCRPYTRTLYVTHATVYTTPRSTSSVTLRAFLFSRKRPQPTYYAARRKADV